MTAFNSVRVKLAPDLFLLLADNTIEEPTSGLAPSPDLPTDWEGQCASSETAALIHYQPKGFESEMQCLRLKELRTYYWELRCTGTMKVDQWDVQSSLSASSQKANWRSKRQSGSLHGTFQFVNYLGTAWIDVLDRASRTSIHRLRFEVVTMKLDYEQEYRSMVEAIATACQQLLLEWDSPTSVNLVQNPEERANTLLEQFLFLRHTLGQERLELVMEALTRNAHSTLESERIWQSSTENSALFLKDPLRYGRDWVRAISDHPGMAAGFNAQRVLTERRYSSVNTSPNQFVKFALQRFRELCEQIIQAEPVEASTGRRRVIRDEQGTAWLEATRMRDSLEYFLHSPLFADVGPLSRVPFESQVLQKREGYRDILQAWLMLHLAAQLHWPGCEDAYDGTNRDVATLYEFWIYFTFVRAFREHLRMEPIQDPMDRSDSAIPWCCTNSDGRMSINLRRGETSFCRFRWQRGAKKLLIHFFYNRRFARSAPGKRGSYSMAFCPDYSLVIIPAEFEKLSWEEAEIKAVQDRNIAYLHFDAKYRVEKLFEILGEDRFAPDEAGTYKAAGTVKTVDLYKMHTYNEAIRRTIGSYVLYPGNGNYAGTGSTQFVRYQEIVPGIGAFALKPESGGATPAGLSALTNFVEDVLVHQASRFTQSYRANFWTETTFREALNEYSVECTDLPPLDKPPKDTQVLLGWVRDEEAAEECRKTRAFFCHAIEWSENIGAGGSSTFPGEATDLNFDPFRSDLFTAYTRFRTTAWIARIRTSTIRLVSAQERATEIGRPVEEMHAAYYYRFELEEIYSTPPRNIRSLVLARSGRPMACSLSAFSLCTVVQ